MQSPAELRFVRMTSSAAAEEVARECIRCLDRNFPGVARWAAYVERPRSRLPGATYAVHVHARLDTGAVLATLAHGQELPATVQDAFDGLEALLKREFPDVTPSLGPWLGTGLQAVPQQVH